MAAAGAGVFLLAGVALLAFVVLLARHGTNQQVEGLSITYVDLPDAAEGTDGTFGPAGPSGRTGVTDDAGPVGGDSALVEKIDRTVGAVQEAALRQMVIWSAVGLLLMSLLAGAAGWWLAGLALRPVASMTVAARRISEQNLHRRLALTGPDDEIHRLADTFDSMLGRLEGAFESQRRFVANASHELRTPLAAQRATLQVGLADPLPPALVEVREDLLATNREAEQLIDALLLLARSDRGPDGTEEVELAETARLVVAELAPLARENAVSLHLTAEDPPTVPGDPVLLRHLLTNLVRNAVQYNRPGGRVDVRLAERSVTVSNTGPRVPAERIPDLFEPFRRLERDRTATEGHGLGLSIAASIAQAHGATLTARPGAEGGLTLVVRLP
ncbi:sensor histidine kinase [Streptomyces bohaiensis]|uniref:sensor histidine kinase n=1 Tax=Streptomyces bohaiensis TaxID=1431344 RepID=UPI001FD7AF61